MISFNSVRSARRARRKQIEAYMALRIREVREERGITQQELAAKVCMSRGSINRFEQGHRIPSFVSLCLIADVLDVSVDEFRRLPKFGRKAV